MSDMSDMTACAVCGGVLERVRYFPRQLLGAEDMRTEQDYFREKLRRHNRHLHGWGVVCGLQVQWLRTATTWTVRVCPGYAVGPQGDEIAVDDCVDVDLTIGATPEPCSVRWPCPPTGSMPGADKAGNFTVYVAVRYAECQTRPTRVHPAGCGCDEALCEYSRTRDSYEVKVLWALPDSHKQAVLDDAAWCSELNTASSWTAVMKRRHQFPIPPCPPCVDDPWVVVATVRFPAKTPPTPKTMLDDLISPINNRVLLSTQRLQVAATCT